MRLCPTTQLYPRPDLPGRASRSPATKIPTGPLSRAFEIPQTDIRSAVPKKNSPPSPPLGHTCFCARSDRNQARFKVCGCAAWEMWGKNKRSNSRADIRRLGQPARSRGNWRRFGWKVAKRSGNVPWLVLHPTAIELFMVDTSRNFVYLWKINVLLFVFVVGGVTMVNF